MKETRPAPLGATYRRDVRPGSLNPGPYAAPNGARPGLCDRSYKYVAPTELGHIPKHPNSDEVSVI